MSWHAEAPSSTACLLWCGTDSRCFFVLQGVQHGIPPQAALTVMSQQLDQAGGSFKKLQKQQLAAAAAVPVPLTALLAAELKIGSSSSKGDDSTAAGMAKKGSSSHRSIVAHPLMSISALDVTETGA
jgi:tRNA A37 threonylcarbamoyladenosine synthetase subunit TsaC/SUA5/YrdC